MNIAPIIRRSTPADAGRVLSIWRAAVDATHHFLQPEDRVALDREVSAFLPTAPLWLAVNPNDEAIRFMLLEGAHMEALFVHSHHAGQGVGRTLVEHAASRSRELTTDVNAQNEQAVAFYRRLGFVPFGHSATDGQGRPYPLIHLRRSR